MGDKKGEGAIEKLKTARPLRHLIETIAAVSWGASPFIGLTGSVAIHIEI